MRKTFTIKIHGDPRSLMPHVRRRAARQGIKLAGDDLKGSFTGMMTGQYEVTGDRARVTVTNKPHFYTWDAVEKWLGGALVSPSHSAGKRIETEADGGTPAQESGDIEARP
ncbi:MAG TPA: hypothetical protein VI893_04100 [Thermoplasmata archaeon]|nr:hypothetical protein [Thermoplasmata archaeon]